MEEKDKREKYITDLECDLEQKSTLVNAHVSTIDLAMKEQFDLKKNHDQKIWELNTLQCEHEEKLLELRKLKEELEIAKKEIESLQEYSNELESPSPYPQPTNHVACQVEIHRLDVAVQAIAATVEMPCSNIGTQASPSISAKFAQTVEPDKLMGFKIQMPVEYRNVKELNSIETQCEEHMGISKLLNMTEKQNSPQSPVRTTDVGIQADSPDLAGAKGFDISSMSNNYSISFAPERDFIDHHSFTDIPQQLEERVNLLKNIVDQYSEENVNFR
jgi:hypothetical protein